MILKENYLLGMDLGTTNIKANIMDEDGEIIATASRPNTPIMPGPGMVEQDPRQWWDNACSILKEITKEAGEEVVRRIRGISVSSQIISLVPVRKDGTPVRNAITYQDTRSADELDYIVNALGYDNYASIMGAPPSVAFLTSKLLWYRKNEPENFAKTEGLVQANGYINLKLTGNIAIDLDCASRSQCMDVKTRKWSKEIGDVIGVDLEKLMPQPVKITDIIGYVTEEAAQQTGLISGIPVCAGASDAMASMYATGISKLGEVGEASGTTSLLFTGTTKLGKYSDPVVTFPCAIDGMPYLYDAPIQTSGAAVKWFLDTWGTAEKAEAAKLGMNDFAYINKIAEEVKPGSEGIMFFPYLLGERAPLWNSYAKGMFIGMSLTSTRDQFFRAVFEGTAYAVRHVISTVSEISGIKPTALRIAGGGAKSITWCRIKASMLHVPVYTLDDKSGDVPFGDVLIAGNAVGVFPELTKTIQKIVKVKEVIDPVPEWEEAYDKLFPYYVDMYKHLDEDLKKYKKTVDSI
jgi:xylulokinase